MSLNDFRVLVDVGDVSGVALEVDDAGHPSPLILSTITPATALTLRLSVHEGRALFDALVRALGYVTAARAATHAAGVDTPDADQPSTV